MTRILQAMLVSSLLGLLASAVRAQVVHVVGPAPGPGVDHTSLPTATAAAADGDIVLVLPGTYAGIANVTNKSLSVVGIPEADGTRPRFETLAVKNSQPDHTVLLRGLASRTDLSATVNSLLVLNCAGPVLVEDCVLDMQAAAVGDGDDSIVVKDSSRVVFTRSVLTGARGSTTINASWPGSPALLCTDSTVTLDACTVSGGTGAKGFPYQFSFVVSPSSAGGDGVSLVSSTLAVRGSSVTGGKGGDGGIEEFNPYCVPPSAGGDALQVDGLLRRLDASLVGGAGGAEECGVVASAGADVNLLSGVVLDLAGQASVVELTASIEDGGDASLVVHGAPGDLVLLFHAQAGLGLWLGGNKGTLAPAVPFVTLVLGLVGVGGELALSFDVPPVLPPGVEGLLVVNQALLLPAGGKGVLSSATASVVVTATP